MRIAEVASGVPFVEHERAKIAVGGFQVGKSEASFGVLMFRRSSHAALALFAVVALSSAACSVVFSTNKEQCSRDEDCTGRGAGFENTKCTLENVCVSGTAPNPTDATTADTTPGVDAARGPFACASDPPTSVDTSKQVDLSIRYIDFTSGLAPANIGARLCAASDPTCANPRTIEGAGPFDAGPEGGKGYVAAKDGVVTAKPEVGFEGFLELKSTVYTPTFRYTSPPLRDPQNPLDQVILRQAEVDFFADTLIGRAGSYDSVNKGLVFLLATDCNRGSIANISFSTTAVDDKMVQFYIVNTTPSTTETKTDPLGRAGYINIPPGLHTFTATFADTGKKMGSVRVFVRAGAATTVSVLPSP